MQLKDVANILGVDEKEVINEVKNQRAEYEGKGFKIAKTVTKATKLDEGMVAEFMASWDLRKQKENAVEREQDAKRKAAEDERRRHVEELNRKKEEEEQKARLEASRLKAEAELARKQAEIKAQKEDAERRDQERRAAEERERAASAAALEAAAAQRAEAEAKAKVAEQLKAAAKAAEPAAAPSVAAPEMKAAAPAAPPAAPPSAPQAQAEAPAQQSRPPYQQREPNPNYQGRPDSGRPHSAPNSRPQTGGPRPPYTERPQGQDYRGGPRPGGPQGDRPQGDRPPRTDFQPRGDRPPGAYPPRTDRPPGSYPPRGDRPPGAYPPRGDRPPGAYPPRGDRPPGAYPPRTGGPGSGPPRGPGAGPRDGRPGDRPSFGRPGDGRGGPGAGRDNSRPASGKGVSDFLNKGIGADSTSETDFQRTRRQVVNKPKAKPVVDREEENRLKRAKAAGDDPGAKRIRPSQLFNATDAITGDRRNKPRKRTNFGQRNEAAEAAANEPKIVRFTGDFTVGEFADRTGIPVGEVIKKLFLMGQMLTINNLLDPDKAEELAVEFEVEIKIEREGDDFDTAQYVTIEDNDENMLPRPPVVTIMGHVDHGKTSLLDRIRKADVASGEFGGITQHIGAYHVSTAKGDIVFLDTPGHEAFTEMRSRGANVTDLVVLVVAANDGVMPQTVEAISHAKAAGVPILVAINKVDVNGANPERVKQELMKYELVPEEYGGETIMIPVSAITGQGLDSLLEYIALQTEVLELKANPDRPAEGTVVESHVDPLRGAVATVLVERGTLRIGDVFVCGTEYGRVRAMRDDRDNQVEAAGPAIPVEILGLRGSPDAGEKFLVIPSESDAREIAERRMARRRSRKAFTKQHISLDNLADRMSEGEVLTLNLIVKGDVQGSVEAIKGALFKIKSDKVAIKILHSAVGAVSASDVQLADASEAIILAFNVSTDPAAREMAEEMGVDVRPYQIIYALLEDMEKAMLGMLEPEFEEKEEGRALVQQTFKVSKVGTVAGCIVKDGVVGISNHARLIRSGAIIWRGKLKSLRRVKDDVKQVLSGVECGIGLENYNDVKDGDIIETYSLLLKTATLVGISENSRKGSGD